MAVSDVDLGNQALAKLMRGSLQTLDGSDIQATQIKLHLQSAVHEVIEEWDWPYCRVISALTAVTLDEAYLRGWAYAYAKPSDLLALWRVSDERDTVQDFAGWELGMSSDLSSDASYIFSDITPLFIRYGSSRVSLSRFPSSLIDLMATKLAIKMCMPLTKDKVLRRDLKQEYTLDLSMLKTRHANAEPEVMDVDFTPETISVRSQ